MNRLAVEGFEGWLRLRNRLRGFGWYPDPGKYFGPGGIDEAEAACLEAGKPRASISRTRCESRALWIASSRAISEATL